MAGVLVRRGGSGVSSEAEMGVTSHKLGNSWRESWERQQGPSPQPPGEQGLAHSWILDFWLQTYVHESPV